MPGFSMTEFQSDIVYVSLLIYLFKYTAWDKVVTDVMFSREVD